jgi:hypothetical protein
LRRLEIARVGENIGLGSDQLVGFGQVRRAAVPDHFSRHPACERIARHAGKGIRTAALERNPEP